MLPKEIHKIIADEIENLCDHNGYTESVFTWIDYIIERTIELQKGTPIEEDLRLPESTC